MLFAQDTKTQSKNEFKDFMQKIDDMISASDFQLLEPCFIDNLHKELRSIASNPAYLNSLPKASMLGRLARSIPSVQDIELLHGKLDMLRRKAAIARQIIRLSRIEVALSLCEFLQKSTSHDKPYASVLG